jgi:hypothetical protein
MSKKYYFIILFLIKKFKLLFYFKNLLPTFSFSPHLMASTYKSWYELQPTRIEHKTSSFPRISLNSPLTHQVPSHKPPSPHAHESSKNVKIPHQQSLTPLNKG